MGKLFRARTRQDTPQVKVMTQLGRIANALERLLEGGDQSPRATGRSQQSGHSTAGQTARNAEENVRHRGLIGGIGGALDLIATRSAEQDSGGLPAQPALPELDIEPEQPQQPDNTLAA